MSLSDKDREAALEGFNQEFGITSEEIAAAKESDLAPLGERHLSAWLRAYELGAQQCKYELAGAKATIAQLNQMLEAKEKYIARTILSDARRSNEAERAAEIEKARQEAYQRAAVLCDDEAHGDMLTTASKAAEKIRSLALAIGAFSQTRKKFGSALRDLAKQSSPTGGTPSGEGE